jgi:hypothetical protein
MPAPELPEALVAYGQLADELLEARVMDVGAGERPQRRDRVPGASLPGS